MTSLHPISALVVAAVVASTGLRAQAIFSNPITGTNPNTSNPFTAGQTTSLDLTASGIGRGSGITGSNANDRYSAIGWNSVSLDTTDYFAWTLAPTTGHTIDLVSFTYTGQASGTGPTSFALRSSVDSFGTSIGAPTATGTTITLTSSSYQGLSGPIEFRLYGWGASSSSGTFSVNDFTFNGAVSAVPEPSTYAALAGMASLGMAFVRRRRARGKAARPGTSANDAG